MESGKQTVWAEVDEQGRLVLPAGFADRYGLAPGARLRLEEGANGIRMHRPVTHLAKLYVEATNRCNLACRTCIRNDWDVVLGQMPGPVFESILAGLASVTPRPSVFFGGLGEPLLHPALPEMVSRAKALGSAVELITNGTLLSDTLSRELIQAGLDILWVSLDAVEAEQYASIRKGAQLPQVLENVRRFRSLRRPGHRARPEIGVAFVAMRSNIDVLPEALRLARRLGATRFMVSNLLPYTADMNGEILYEHTTHNITYLPSTWLPRLNLPKMDLNPATQKALFSALTSGYNVTFAGNNLGGENDVCTFIESGSLTIGWDGSAAPCPPLLYSHWSYLQGYRRVSRRHIVGNVTERPLLELWNDPEYRLYRERVQSFAFPPCTFCGGCDLSLENQSDCFGNPAPACGGCLWAQGIVQCP